MALSLVVSETSRCLGGQLVQEMEVDTSRDEKMHIEFNITFPSLPCRAFRVDYGDKSGNFETESIMERAQCVP